MVLGFIFLTSVTDIGLISCELKVGVALFRWAVTDHLHLLRLHLERSVAGLSSHKFAWKTHLTGADWVRVGDAEWLKLRVWDRGCRGLNCGGLELDVLLLVSYHVLCNPICIAPTRLSWHLVLITLSRSLSSISVVTLPNWHWSLMHGFLNVLDVSDVILDLLISNHLSPVTFILAWIVHLKELLVWASYRLFDTVSWGIIEFLGLKRLKIEYLLINSLLFIQHDLLPAIRIELHMHQALCGVSEINVINWASQWLLKSIIWSKWLQEFILGVRLVQD